MNDHAEIGPVSILLIATLVLIFEGVIFGSQLAENSIITSVPSQVCNQGSGFGSEIGWIACNTANFFIFILNIFLVIGSVIAFFFNAVTFNVPGAPWYIRIFVSVIFVGGMGWAIASLVRGTKA